MAIFRRGVTLIELLVVIVIIGVISGAGSGGFLDLLVMGEMKVEEELFRSSLRQARSLAIANNCDAFVQLYRFNGTGLTGYGGYKILVANSAQFIEDGDLINNLDIAGSPTPTLAATNGVIRNFNPRNAPIDGNMNENSGVRKNIYIPLLAAGVLDPAGFPKDRIVFNRFGQMSQPDLPGTNGVLTIGLVSFDGTGGQVRISETGGRIF